MNQNDWEKLASRMQALVTRVADVLPQRDVTNARELIDAGEFGVAFELVCTQLDENDAAVGSATLAAFAAVGESMGFDSNVWSHLASDHPEDPRPG